MNKLFLLSLGGLMLTACSQGTNKEVVAEKGVAETDHASVVSVPSNLELRDRLLIAKQRIKTNVTQTGLLTGELQITSGEGLNVILLITNNQAYGVLIQYRSGMTADLHIMDPQGEKVWAWSDDMMFTQALRDISIASGQVLKQQFTVPESVLSQIKGRGYSLVATYVGHATESNQASMTDITVSLDPYIN